MQRIRLIEHIRGNKWKAKWVDPNPGLIDYITTAQIIVPWRKKKDFLKDEVNLAAIDEHNDVHGYKFDSPVTLAIEQIFESAGDGVGVSRGILSGTPDQVNRISARAGCSAYEVKRPAYIDRKGVLHLPFDQAFELGRKLCMAEPSTVLIDIEATERKWSISASRPGEEYIIPLLNSYRASWALVRQWAGLDATVAARDEQIRRLERLVWDAIYALQEAGLDSKANKLRRAIGDRS
jgi:hypothetical protein